MNVAEWSDLAQTMGIVGAGLWAVFVYARSRRGEVRVGIEHDVRVKDDFSDDVAVLVVHLVIRNSSDVLWRRDKSNVTVYDARRLAADGSVRLMPFGYADPFLPVYGTSAETLEEFEAGYAFSFFEGQQITLEPGETVDVELAFPLAKEKLGLMAVKVWLSGFQGKFSKAPYEWATIFYVDPAVPAGSAG